jgi:hypothetical protein
MVRRGLWNEAKLFGIAFATLIAWTVFGTTSALAQSPHFIGTPSCTKSITSGLTCSGKAAGVGNEPANAFLTASSVTATYECVNRGGNIAPGQPVVTQNVTGPVELIQPRNGQITFLATIPVPPTPSSAVVCPNGNWTVRLTSLTFTNVVLHIQDQVGQDILTFNFGTIDP